MLELFNRHGTHPPEHRRSYTILSLAKGRGEIELLRFGGEGFAAEG
jgi:hypothetical protein